MENWYGAALCKEARNRGRGEEKIKISAVADFSERKERILFMKIGYMIVGCIFLFNPFINIIDILPDFIGYLFIMRALTELSDLLEILGLGV